MKILALATTVAFTMTGTSVLAQTQAATGAEHDHTHGAAAAPAATPPAPPPATPVSPAPPAGQGMEGMSGMGGMKGMEGKPSMGGMSGMGDMQHMPMMQPTAANPFPPAEMQMHMAMMHATGADANETYVRKMIEHHRGAIAMSRLVLTSTKDARVQRLANQDIAAQTRDVAGLQAWLSRNGKTAQ
ncbi:DUF305 domain-containing protein [Novosphingobium lentum]|uniref:DUF305 domain-containing protein n=1 Tax=Novosphingobium lentum TaxID=145287 RepID=UPI000A599D73|nr:DUF305 domain-containing protein [Novosphingobium lentum]